MASNRSGTWPKMLGACSRSAQTVGNEMNCLEHSEHFQLFLYCLGLPSNQPVRQWIWDTSQYYGIQRKRIFLRSHLDTDVPSAIALSTDKEWGQLVMINGEDLPLAPLLRTRGITNQGVLKLSWTGYQPSALMWDYSYFGGKKSFRLLSQWSEGMKIPSLPWANIVPAHFLSVWRSFLVTIQSDKSSTTKKDQLVEQLAPIFHNPNIEVPMRILTVQEVRKLAGLENILTNERHGNSLLTEQVIRDFCGNSFHPSLISAALGTDDQLQQWVDGTNDAQPCATEPPCVKDAYAKYRDLLKLVIEQAAKKGFQLKSDRIDFEAKWQHLAPKATSPSIQPPAIQQPLVFSFLQGSKSTNEQHTRATQSLHYGDEEFYSCLSQYGLEWLRDSAHTYENINLSAHMMRLAVQNGVGFRTENQEVRTKHAQLFQEYTANEHLKAIKQLFAVFQIATLSNLHQFPFGFLIWAPKIMQPPFVYVGAQRPCLIFLILSQEPDQPFKFGTVAFDYRQDRDFLAHSRTLNICADVVQLSYHSLATFPITVRVNEGLQYIHLSEFATLQCPTCALCYLHSLGAAPCFLHQVTPANAVIHLVGGMDGTGGLIIIGTMSADSEATVETINWIVIHILALPQTTMQEVGYCILGYRKEIRQDLPFRLKRLHVWNLSGWNPTVKGSDAKMRLVKRLLRTGPILIQETRWHAETHQVLFHNIPGIQVAHTQGNFTDRGGTSGGTAILIPPGWKLDRTEIILPGRIVMAVVQDRYSTIGILSVYLHPTTKVNELRELVTWAKNSRIDFPLYLGGDFNQADVSCPDLWQELLIHAHVTDTCPWLQTFEGPNRRSALDRILCPTDYIAAAQMDVLVSATRRHHLSGHYQLTGTFVVRPKVKSDITDPVHQTIPSDVFCPGKNEADPYMIPNDLQELIRRIQRLPQTDEVDFVATLWSWWRQQPIPSNHPRIPDYELLRKFLKIRAEVLHVPSTHFYALQDATHHIFATNVISEIYPGKVTIRSDLLKQIFDFLDQITASRQYPDVEQVNQQARGIGSNITFWNRLRAICPKGAIYNGPVRNRNGEQCTTSKMLDEAMLDTRHFWFEKPQDVMEEWEPVLTEYQTASSWPEIEMPNKQDFLHTLLGTKDSAPGPDGIPYSAWRLSPEDSYPVLDQLMMRMVSGLRAAPVQVGVWIPKAKVGPTADFFRPLGMPNTCDRLVDGTIAAVVMKATSAHMHPSQVVMNCFKEPQHAVHAIQALLDSTTPVAALLVDLSKAFERVNPYWILRILRMRRAPTWVCNYARYILFGRLIRHKVQGRLLPPRAVHVGVDMGRSFSVFLFCLAMDPIYHYLNRIPRVMSVQGYIDDNTIAGPGHDIAWVGRVHYCYQCCRTAGFQIDQHSCWQALSTDSPPFSVQQVSDYQESIATDRLPTFPTARAAILAAILPKKTLILIRAGKCLGLTPSESCDILQGTDYSLISPLLALECSCRCKTALVINTPLPSWVLRQIDQAGFGVHCIQGVATALGLLLLGRAQLADRNLWTVTSHPTTLKQINPKAAEKFIHRLRLFRQPVLSVVSKSIAFNTFAQSVVLYTTSYFGAATEDLQMLRSAATELLLGRNWIRQDFLAFVFRWLKIAPLLDPGVSIMVSALGLFLRKGGLAHELYEEYPPAVNRQTHEVRVLCQAWARIIGDGALTRALASQGSIKQRVHAVKKCILEHMTQLASQYIRNKVLTSGWTGGIGWKWLSEAREANKRWIPGVTRFALLRWAVNEDDDEWLARRGQSRQKQCIHCINQARAYPFGGHQVAICETCISSKQITALTLYARDSPPRNLPRIGTLIDQMEQGQAWESCVACGHGDNTIGHWVRWCTVPVLALRDLTGDSMITSLAECSRKGPKQLAIASRMVHQFRLLLREAGAMRHQTTAPLVPREVWINKLAQRVREYSQNFLQTCVCSKPLGLIELNDAR